MNPNPPLYAIPKPDYYRVQVSQVDIIDSYDVGRIVEEYGYCLRLVRDRVTHSRSVKAYVAAFGSIPYIYAVGSLFSGGNVPLKTLEFNRSKDVWHTLDEIGLGPDLQICYNGSSDPDSILRQVNGKVVGVALSFSAEIQVAELPASVRDKTIMMSLSAGVRYDALLVESVQDEIVKGITHYLTRIFKTSQRIDLFIAAQTSVVLKLGRLYQKGMMNEVVVYNYNAKTRSYDWGVAFDGNDCIREVACT